MRPEGLYCEPGGFFIDPVRPVPRAVITHAHADHARPGHGAVLASPETMALMDVRMGEGRAGDTQQTLDYGQTLSLGDVSIWLQPAGHVLGSAQVAMEYRGSRAVVSGDYKRVPDPTCRPFVTIPCDVFVTEATFALPVFRHPLADGEVRKLLDSVALFPERTHVVGAYALGKAQRVIAHLREAGYDQPIYLHGAMLPLCAAYERLGIPLGPLLPATVQAKAELAGAIVIAPPSAIADRWARRLAEPVTCMASGWMRVRQRAKSKGVELPLVISDHSDWDELLQTLDDVAAPEVWVTHGREEALIHAAAQRGIHGRALRLVGYGDEEEETPEPEENPPPPGKGLAKGRAPHPNPTPESKEKPSPPGRGLGEGLAPHPDPTPESKEKPLPSGRGLGEGLAPHPDPTPASKERPSPLGRGLGEGVTPNSSLQAGQRTPR